MHIFKGKQNRFCMVMQDVKGLIGRKPLRTSFVADKKNPLLLFSAITPLVV
jgi:hypothetical protein